MFLSETGIFLKQWVVGGKEHALVTHELCAPASTAGHCVRALDSAPSVHVSAEWEAEVMASQCCESPREPGHLWATVGTPLTDA